MEVGYSLSPADVLLAGNSVEVEVGKLILDEVDFEGGTAGVRAPSNADIHARKTTFKNVGIGFDLYEPKNLELSGLPPDVKKELVEEVLAHLRQMPNASVHEMTEVVVKSRLATWIGNAEAVSKAATGLIALVKAGIEIFKP